MVKLITLISLLGTAHSLTQIDGVTYDYATHGGYGCHYCVRHGWSYCTKDAYWSVLATGNDYDTDNKCCENTDTDSADCGTAFVTKAVATGFRCTGRDFYQNPDMALAACPQRQDICGAASNVYEFDNENTAT